MKFFDLIDKFREWEKTHNKDNYGKFDAFAAGYKIGIIASDDLARLMIIQAEQTNAATYSIRWDKLEINPEWNLIITVKKTEKKKRKK